GSKLGNYTVQTNAGTLAINPATLLVTADAKSRAYGGTNPVLSATISGFVNGDTAATAVTGAAALSTSAGASTGVGNYPISVSQGTLHAANYNFSFTAGSLTITPANLSGFADNKSRLYGQNN